MDAVFYGYVSRRFPGNLYAVTRYSHFVVIVCKRKYCCHGIYMEKEGKRGRGSEGGREWEREWSRPLALCELPRPTARGHHLTDTATILPRPNLPLCITLFFLSIHFLHFPRQFFRLHASPLSLHLLPRRNTHIYTYTHSLSLVRCLQISKLF